MARRLWLAALLMTAFLAGCSGDGGGGDGNGPTGGTGGNGDGSGGGGGGGTTAVQGPANPPVGTTWDYDFGGVSSGSQHMVLEAHEAKNGHDTMRLKTTGGAQGANAEVTAWNRRSDGANVQADTETTAPVVGTFTTTTTWDPPCQQMRYPVVTGDKYESSCTSTTSTSAGGQPTQSTTRVNVEVLELGDATVPAGTFPTVHVRTTQEGSVTDAWYLRNGCGIARSETVGSDGTRSTLELTATTCM